MLMNLKPVGSYSDTKVSSGTVFFVLIIVSYRIVSYRNVSYRIVSYRIVSFRIQSCRILVSNRMVPYRIAIVSYLSYQIVWHRMLSYRIVSYRILSYRTFYFDIASYAFFSDYSNVMMCPVFFKVSTFQGQS